MYGTFVYINLVKTPFLYTNVKLESSIDPYAFEYKSGFDKDNKTKNSSEFVLYQIQAKVYLIHLNGCSLEFRHD